MKTEPLAQNRLREVLDYDPITGLFTWKPRVVRSEWLRTDRAFNARRAGTKAGSSHKKGYIQIKIDDVLHRANRLAWLWMTGKLPEVQVDHINRRTGDDRWDNLRLATNTQNAANSGKRANNKSGYKGVSKCPATGRWKVQINENGLRKYLGIYDDLLVAAEVYRSEAARLHGEFAEPRA
jgi:HNH endonuclease